MQSDIKAMNKATERLKELKWMKLLSKEDYEWFMKNGNLHWIDFCNRLFLKGEDIGTKDILDEIEEQVDSYTNSIPIFRKGCYEGLQKAKQIIEKHLGK